MLFLNLFKHIATPEDATNYVQIEDPAKDETNEPRKKVVQNTQSGFHLCGTSIIFNEI